MMIICDILANPMTGHQTRMITTTKTTRHPKIHLLQKLSLFFFPFQELNLTGKLEKQPMVGQQHLAMLCFSKLSCLTF